MFATTKFGKKYYRFIEIITDPIVKINRHSKVMQKHPTLYYQVRTDKKVSDLIKECRSLDRDSPNKNKILNRAAKHYLLSKTSEELKARLSEEIERLRDPLSQEDEVKIKELMENLVSQFSSLIEATGNGNL